MSVGQPSPILLEVKNHIGAITLNRPQALNSLTRAMLFELTQTLKQWEHDHEVRAVIIKGAGQRAFCSGFDLREIYALKQQGDQESLYALFKKEYQLNYYISTFPKPYIALMQGYTMGGGLGISVYGSHRIVCEGTTLAMPEVTIGLFPDIGASYFLNQCPGLLGFHLALSGAHISAEDGLYAGLATHCLQQDDYEAFSESLAKGDIKAREDVDHILRKFQRKPKPSHLAQLQTKIDRLFNQETFEDVIKALEQDKSEFSKSWLANMALKSPTSLKVTFELMKRARGKTLCETIEYDYLLVRKFLMNHDLFEGIRARIIDKDLNPQWQPKALGEVDDELVQSYFNTLSFPALF